MTKKRKAKQNKLRRLSAQLPLRVRDANVRGIPTPKERVAAVELPLRARAANMGGITARNENSPPSGHQRSEQT